MRLVLGVRGFPRQGALILSREASVATKHEPCFNMLLIKCDVYFTLRFMIKRMQVIDFFCGAGGFSEGFRQAGYDIVMGIDNWQPAITTHNANHALTDTPKSVLDFENLDEIDKLPNTEIIVGSPPCVLFSLSNRGGNANKDLGIRQIEAFFRVVAVKKHQKNSSLVAWLMENVPNSRNYVREKYTFSNLGLSGWAKANNIHPNATAIRVKNNGDILHADDYGSGQARKRFVCGELTKDGRFPVPDKIENQDKSLSAIFSNFPKPFEILKSDYIVDPNYENICIRPEDLRDHHYDSGVYEIEWRKAQEAKQNHPYMGRMFFPENRQNPSRTIMATKSSSTREAILYKSEIARSGDGEYRTPTIREAAIIMGFPITYQFFGDESTKWRQIGNAVCVQLAYALAEKIREQSGFRLPEPKNTTYKFEGFTFLDNESKKTFSHPPTRNPNALFRAHPIKSGNMTIDLTNRAGKNKDNWGVVAHTGTGKGYGLTEISKIHFEEARAEIVRTMPEFITSIHADACIKPYTDKIFNQKNAEYGYLSFDSGHPYQIVKRVESYIVKAVNGKGDYLVDTNGTQLASIKEKIPISQILAIYSLGILLYDK